MVSQLCPEALFEGRGQLRRHVRQHDVGPLLIRRDEVFDLAFVADLALDDDGHAIAHHLDVGQDVGVHEDGLAVGAQPQDQIADLLASQRVESAHGLVEEHDLRVVDQRLGDARALQHALRVGTEARIAGVGEAHPAEQRRDPLGPIGARDARQLGVEVEELDAGQVVVEVRDLRKEAHVLSEARLLDVVAQDAGRACRRTDETHQRLQHRGLARAVRPDESEDFVLLHAEGDAVEHPLGAQTQPWSELLDEALEPDDFPAFRCHCSLPSRTFVFAVFADGVNRPGR